jgi:hypothetical protein
MFASLKTIFYYMILIAILAMNYNCNDIGSTPHVSSPPVSFVQNVQPIFNNSCSCHSGNSPSAGMNLSASSSYLQLINIQSVSSCISLKRVLPSVADSSTLYRKISGTTCGTQMPQGGTISNSSISTIGSWINQGALNN